MRAKEAEHPCRSRHREHTLGIVTHDTISRKQSHPHHVLVPHIEAGHSVWQIATWQRDRINIEVLGILCDPGFGVLLLGVAGIVRHVPSRIQDAKCLVLLLDQACKFISVDEEV